ASTTTRSAQPHLPALGSLVERPASSSKSAATRLTRAPRSPQQIPYNLLECKILNPIDVILRVADLAMKDEHIDHLSNGPVMRQDEHAGRVMTSLKMVCQVSGHGPAVFRDDNASVLFGQSKFSGSSVPN